MHKSRACTKSSICRSGRKQGIVESVRGTMHEDKTKKDRRATTTARSIDIDAIVKEENTTSVNTTTNQRVEKERALVSDRERGLLSEVEREH
jgi:hypothetical protein